MERLGNETIKSVIASDSRIVCFQLDKSPPPLKNREKTKLNNKNNNKIQSHTQTMLEMEILVISHMYTMEVLNTVG